MVLQWNMAATFGGVSSSRGGQLPPSGYVIHVHSILFVPVDLSPQSKLSLPNSIEH